MIRQDPVVEARGLTKRYGGRRDGTIAVDHVDLTVNRGEVYGFLGPNGAGKTTTLRMLLGLVAPSSGSASVLGERPGTSRALRRVGALIEGPGFYPYLSGRDNLEVVARYAGVPAARVDETLATVELTGRGGDKFAAYSLGMKQRLGVAAALLKEPDLVMLDEPTNGLDPAGMRDMRALIRRLGEHGHTVLLSSHLLGEVQQICDRVGVIDRGRMLTESTVQDLRGNAELLVVATPGDTARWVLDRMPQVEHVRAAEDVLRVQAEERHTAAIVRALVDANVAVTMVRRDERQLEDVFFEMTTERASAGDGDARRATDHTTTDHTTGTHESVGEAHHHV